ncbi:MAG TPA: DUF2520 domain-containing protein [Gemmatimonas sp.]|nr:DUF2520 domain-containing protein [Gemmatimonas sp.]
MAVVPAAAIVGHCSASEPLDTLAPNRRFALHPLMTLIGETTNLGGAFCAIDGSDGVATGVATALAELLGMTPMRVPAAQRSLYHAAASIASNYLVTLEWAAERAAAQCGIPRDALAPLVQATLDAWRTRGFAGAITGPVARGDVATVARQREAIATSAPELLILFDAMAHTTRIALQDSPPSSALARDPQSTVPSTGALPLEPASSPSGA